MASTSNILLFEQPLTKVPYEQLRKGFRTTQRNFERDFTQLSANACDIRNTLSQDDLTTNRSSTEASLDAMIARVEALKRKIADVQDTTSHPMQRALRARADHLMGFETTTPEDSTYQHWVDVRMQRWIVDSMLRSGRFEAAQTLANDLRIDALVDVPVFAEIQRITSALRSQSCSEALSWCNENKAALRKTKSTLEFELRLQEFVELVRSGKSFPAIAYSKKHLAAWHDLHPSRLRQAMTLLAYGSKVPKNATYRRLYDLERWQFLANTFQDTAYSLTSLSSTPLLSLALYAGLSALKHPICVSSDVDEMEDGEAVKWERKYDCPVCDAEGLGILAREVPSSQHHNSSLVCAMSGDIIDDNNPPLAFNNGYVYSRSALQDMADRTNGAVTCPRSGQTMNFREMRKVFVT